MEVKPTNIIEFEVSIHDRSYRFALPVGAPLGDAYNATIAIANKIVERMSSDLSYCEPKKPENEE